MPHIFREKNTDGLFQIYKEDNTEALKGEGILKEDTINSIVYNGYKDQTVVIDEVPYTFPARSVLPLVTNQHFVFEHPEMLTAWQFNREFYCIVDHDAEVGCVGFLFYGIKHPLFIALSDSEAADIEAIEKMCFADMRVKDRMQGEMLRTLLKRLIISITRIARKQTANVGFIDDEKLDVIRMFNLTVEGHFKTQHSVQFYARALNRSPKTLSNLFATLSYPPPSKVIQNRILLEAKRLLNYSGKTAKEIAYMLGFDTPAHFSRFFKQQTGKSISEFRN